MLVKLSCLKFHETASNNRGVAKSKGTDKHGKGLDAFLKTFVAKAEEQRLSNLLESVMYRWEGLRSNLDVINNTQQKLLST
jgi:hypothetical protein